MPGDTLLTGHDEAVLNRWKKTNIVAVQELLHPDGAGIMCLVAAASSLRLAPPLSPLWLPSRVLEFDMQGRIEVGYQVVIDIGEAKNTLDYGKSVDQLGIRLLVLKLAAKALLDVPDSSFVLTGRLFVPHSAVTKNASIVLAQKKRAWRVWGYSLHMHAA